MSDHLEKLAAGLRERIRIVLVHPLQPGNVGATARAMKNMGLRQLYVVAPPAFDMERARWMAGGAKGLLETARFVATVEEAVADCHLAVGSTTRARRWNWPVVEPPQLAATALDADGPVAILFGREDTGLDNDSLGRCQMLLRIPTDGEPSLNLSQAVLLTCNAILEEARRRGWQCDEPPRQGRRSGGASKGEKAPPQEATPATLAEQAVVVDEAYNLLARTPYMRGRNEEQLRIQLSMMLQRLAPTDVEVKILRGMMRKTDWSIENGPVPGKPEQD